MVSPGCARRTMMRPPRDGLQVEGVQRLAQRPQDVVGDVHHVADGPHAGVSDAGLEPQRRLADRDAADDPGRVARAQIGVADLDGDVLVDRRGRPRGSGSCASSSKGASVMAAISRAMPRTERQSGRLGVTSTSSTGSEMGKYVDEQRRRPPSRRAAP